MTPAAQQKITRYLAETRSHVGRPPLDALRGTGIEEKTLKNAKDACATEALEIATSEAELDVTHVAQPA